MEPIIKSAENANQAWTAINMEFAGANNSLKLNAEI